MTEEPAQQEREAAFNEEAGRALSDLKLRLSQLHLPHIANRRRAIILFEGPEGAGKKYALRQLTAALDPCHFTVHCTRHERREASEGHWLARFWRQLPAAGDTSIFLRSWYRRVLDDRLVGRIDDKTAARAFDEINEFEAQQRDYGTVLVKLYFEVSAEVQERRLRERAENPWAAIINREPVVEVQQPEYADALQQLRANSDTRWSPWRMIDGNDEGLAAVAALSVIADALAAGLPAVSSSSANPPSRAA
ncbi:polyphosphate kinase 2 (PPK2 family) [Sphingomonas sp. F9_3S_D5_B_2]